VSAGKGIAALSAFPIDGRALLCAYLAGALLLGLLGDALVGAWWLDPAVGLLIAALAVKEGLEAWRGEGCCA
jgi:divalent metal cation (Fe/Co/Zn/Cd) transporter